MMAYVPQAFSYVPLQNRSAMMHGRVQSGWRMATRARSFSHSESLVSTIRLNMCNNSYLSQQISYLISSVYELGSY